jgi:hypothetical protein
VIRQHPSLADDPRPYVGTADGADGDDAAVSINVALIAGYGQPAVADKTPTLGEVRGLDCMGPAPWERPCCPAGSTRRSREGSPRSAANAASVDSGKK